MDEPEGQAADASPALSQQSTSGNGNHKGKSSRVLSCQMCQKRKTKCDKKFPCQNCLKVVILVSNTCIVRLTAPC